jgi:hypothetical protein
MVSENGLTIIYSPPTWRRIKLELSLIVFILLHYPIYS